MLVWVITLASMTVRFCVSCFDAQLSHLGKRSSSVFGPFFPRATGSRTRVTHASRTLHARVARTPHAPTRTPTRHTRTPAHASRTPTHTDRADYLTRSTPAIPISVSISPPCPSRTIPAIPISAAFFSAGGTRHVPAIPISTAIFSAGPRASYQLYQLPLRFLS